MDWAQVEKKFKELEKFESMVFVHIPLIRIKTQLDVRNALMELEREWMQDFNHNEKYYLYQEHQWNGESRIYGKFGKEELYFDTKFSVYDGTEPHYYKNDFRSKRGFSIRDHYGKKDVVAVHLIADNLEEFLKSKKIKYKRQNFLR